MTSPLWRSARLGAPQREWPVANPAREVRAGAVHAAHHQADGPVVVNPPQMLDCEIGASETVGTEAGVAGHRARSVDEDHGRLAVRPSKTQIRSAEDACHDEAVDPSADEVIDQGQLRIRASPRAGDHDRPAVRIGRLCDGGHELDEERVGRVGKDKADHLSGAATQSLSVHVRSVVKLGDRLP